MQSKDSAAKLAAALADAKTQAANLGDRLAPAVDEAMNRLGPVVDDARERVAPVVLDARDRLIPVLEDAKVRLADLGDTVAARLDEAVTASKAADGTAAAAKPAGKKGKGGGRTRKVLLLGALSAGVAFVVQRLRSGSGEPQWQSTAPNPPPPPRSTPTTTAGDAAPGTTVGTQADAAGATPGEAASDAVEEPHPPTTPDAPAERIDLTE